MNIVDSIQSAQTRLQRTSPLVLNVTNYVVMQLTANALLAVGASPVMAHANEEVAEMTAHANALVINIGTLSGEWVNSMRIACQRAKDLQIPIVLDPVGAGATSYRTKTACELIESYQPTIIRGNASEIAALFSTTVATRGVDSTMESSSVLFIAQKAAKEIGSIICISGAKDFITDGARTVCIENGHGMMAKTTGMGCTASALMAGLCANESDYFFSAVTCMAMMGIAGELAAQHARGVGAFPMHFVDALSEIDHEVIESRLRYQTLET